jgi:hypothetical protein
VKKDEEQDRTQRNPALQRTKAIVSWLVGTGGAAMTLHPPSAAVGVGVAATAPVAGWAAERVYHFLSEMKARRVEEVTDRVRDELEREGLGDSFDAVKDIVIEAVPIIGDAETEEKRQMIANVILNTAARAKDEAAKAEAMQALACIRELPAAAALVFAFAARERREQGDNMRIAIASGESYAGLPWGVVVAAVVKMNFQDLTNSAVTSEGTVIDFAPLGDWLRDWIERNPPANTRQATPDHEEPRA